MKNSCSLIIATYNWPAALQLCLESVQKQEVLPDEIIIADDGSGLETKELVEKYRKLFAMPVKHIWQPDNGYQLARIRNKAFTVASSDYLIQIDGDLILHSSFIKDHLAFRKKGRFVSGARSLISQELTLKIIQSLDSSLLQKDSRHLHQKYNAIHSKLLAWINYTVQRTNKSFHYVLGCNMAFWKKDLEKVNGYNEDFTGWGKEDNDLAIRLINAGIKLRFVKFGAIVYHLHHTSSPRAGFAFNDALFKKSILNKITYVEKGMKQREISIINL